VPFKSKKQEKWMWANKPKMARKWAKKYGSFRKLASKRKKK